MRRTLGWTVLLIGFFLLGIWLNQLLLSRHPPLSPVPLNPNLRSVTLAP